MRFNPLDYPLAFMYPDRMSRACDWWGHIPFAATLVQAIRPRKIVELGVYLGGSLACFAQASEALSLDNTITGIDLWQSMNKLDDQDPADTREVFAFFEKRFPKVVLDRRDFNVAVLDHPDNSINLLHIDGDHTTEAVAHDFYTWLPKLAPDGIMLFHDIALTTVAEVWNQLRCPYPSFEFHHCWGLGVLAPKGVPTTLSGFFDGSEDAESIQTFYQLMGSRTFVSNFYRQNHGDELLFRAIDHPVLISNTQDLVNLCNVEADVRESS